jgi:hypothetical protein
MPKLKKIKFAAETTQKHYLTKVQKFMRSLEEEGFDNIEVRYEISR